MLFQLPLHHSGQLPHIKLPQVRTNDGLMLMGRCRSGVHFLPQARQTFRICQPSLRLLSLGISIAWLRHGVHCVAGVGRSARPSPVLPLHSAPAWRRASRRQHVPRRFGRGAMCAVIAALGR